MFGVSLPWRSTTSAWAERTSIRFMVTENLLGRIEFGFAADRLGLGTLPGDINKTLPRPTI